MNFTTLRALIIDIDGTLWRGEQPLPGVVELFDFLQQQEIAFMVVTNNTTKTPAQYWRGLFDLGVELWSEQVMTAGAATVDYLRQEFAPGAPLYVIGEAALHQLLLAGNFEIVPDASAAVAAVVVGGDSGLTYAKLKHAILHIQRRARLIGTNPDLLVPTEEGLIPEAGTTLAALRAATGVAPTVIGKPERHLFELALARLGSSPAATAMVGDRLETDVLGAQRAGLRSILVTTGVDGAESIRRKGIEPDFVAADLPALVAAWGAFTG